MFNHNNSIMHGIEHPLPRISENIAFIHIYINIYKYEYIYIPYLYNTSVLWSNQRKFRLSLLEENSRPLRTGKMCRAFGVCFKFSTSTTFFFMYLQCTKVRYFRKLHFCSTKFIIITLGRLFLKFVKSQFTILGIS